MAPEELMAMIASKPLLFKPGEQSRYSNAGYVVLANVVQKASGMAFCDYLRSKIFAPLGMRDTGCVTSGTIISQLAEGYVPGAGIELLHAPVRDPSSLFGSGNVYSTAHDLDLWLRAVDGKLLFDIARLEYPFGWGKRKWYGRDLIVQSGIAAGYSSIILTVPAEQLNITIVMNTQSGFTADEGKTPLGFVYGELASPPVTRPTTSIAVPADKLAAYSGNYVFPQGQIPMHIQATNGSLALRWDHSTSLVELTPLSQNEFLDRSSFGKIVFEPERLFWVDKERKLECPKQQGQ